MVLWNKSFKYWVVPHFNICTQHAFEWFTSNTSLLTNVKLSRLIPMKLIYSGFSKRGCHFILLKYSIVWVINLCTVFCSYFYTIILDYYLEIWFSLNTSWLVKQKLILVLTRNQGMEIAVSTTYDTSKKLFVSAYCPLNHFHEKTISPCCVYICV